MEEWNGARERRVYRGVGGRGDGLRACGSRIAKAQTCRRPQGGRRGYGGGRGASKRCAGGRIRECTGGVRAVDIECTGYQSPGTIKKMRMSKAGMTTNGSGWVVAPHSRPLLQLLLPQFHHLHLVLSLLLYTPIRKLFLFPARRLITLPVVRGVDRLQLSSDDDDDARAEDAEPPPPTPMTPHSRVCAARVRARRSLHTPTHSHTHPATPPRLSRPTRSHPHDPPSLTPRPAKHRRNIPPTPSNAPAHPLWPHPPTLRQTRLALRSRTGPPAPQLLDDFAEVEEGEAGGRRRQMEAGKEEKCPYAIEGQTEGCAVKDKTRTMRSAVKRQKKKGRRENGERRRQLLKKYRRKSENIKDRRKLGKLRTWAEQGGKEDGIRWEPTGG
ncbi:hypothetical protein C8J57DRAFT_1481161 [Mycena rebaudengoi]|nr:hypothetical protein C8J57DRAFT_1481161 [Mycena rebaudengoi]